MIFIGVCILGLLVVIAVLLYQHPEEWIKDMFRHPSYFDKLGVRDRPRIVVTLTTSPKRLSKIKQVIDSIMTQTVLPDIIYLNIPKVFKRTGEVFDGTLPSFITMNHLIDINVCEDIGPATKVLPVLELESDPETCIVSIDDDFRYDSTMINTLIGYSMVFPDMVIGGHSPIKYRYKGPQLDEINKIAHENNLMTDDNYLSTYIQGFCAVAYRRKHLEDFDYSVLENRNCYLVDDYTISNHLNKKNITILIVELRYVNWGIAYGLGSDALHRGANDAAGGHGNDRNDQLCRQYLQENNKLFF